MKFNYYVSIQVHRLTNLKKAVMVALDWYTHVSVTRPQTT